MATNVVASQPPERRPTGAPHARANYCTTELSKGGTTPTDDPIPTLFFLEVCSYSVNNLGTIEPIHRQNHICSFKLNCQVSNISFIERKVEFDFFFIRNYCPSVCSQTKIYKLR